METLSLTIKQAIENIDTRKLIFKTPFEDRFTNTLAEKLNCNSPYFCIEQYPLKLGDDKRDSKIDLVGFNKKENHTNLINFESTYSNAEFKKCVWVLKLNFIVPIKMIKII